MGQVSLVNGTFGLGAAAGPALIGLTHGGYLFAVVAVCVLVASLFWLGIAMARLLVPVVTRSWTEARLLVTALLACGGGLTLLAADGSAPVGFLLLGMLVGPVFPTTLAWIAATLPHPRRVNAVVLSVAMFGNATVPVFIGYGMRATSDLALPVFVLCCLVVVVALRRVTQRVASSE